LRDKQRAVRVQQALLQKGGVQCVLK